MAMNSANDLELLSLVAKMPRASLEAVVLDMVATGHPINEGELEVAATEDEACLGACAVAPARRRRRPSKPRPQSQLLPIRPR